MSADDAAIGFGSDLGPGSGLGPGDRYIAIVKLAKAFDEMIF